MRIIYLHQYYNNPDMSGGTRSYEMARRMVSAGHEVHMITSVREEKPQATGWFTTNDAGINVHWYPVPYSNHMNHFQRIAAFFSFAIAAKKKAASLSADVIFATSTPLTIAIPAVLTARKKEIPMVFEVRDLWPEMPIAVGALRNPVLKYVAKKLERWAYFNSSAVVALSPGMKEGVARTGYPFKRIAVIPNSCDIQEFAGGRGGAGEFRSERPWLGQHPLLIYAGALGRVNGVGYAVELASELNKINSNVRILVVGSGAEREKIIAEARRAQVYNQNIYFEPAMSKKDMPKLFGAATMASSLVIDLPEARANSANKFFDALAAGKPVFINHGGWMHDLILSHGCGLTVWRKPIETVARQLHENLNDDVWLESSAYLAKKIAAEYFSRDILAAQLIAVLEAAVNKNPEIVSDIAPGTYC